MTDWMLAMQGVKEKAILPPALQIDPGTLSAEEWSTQGIKPLAANLAGALAGFSADTGESTIVPTLSSTLFFFQGHKCECRE